MNQIEINKRRQELLEQIEQLDKEEKALHELTPEQRNATNLHNMLCHLDHTDQCGWYYEKEWNERTHVEWLGNAEAINRIVPVDKFCEAYDAFVNPRAN